VWLGRTPIGARIPACHIAEFVQIRCVVDKHYISPGLGWQVDKSLRSRNLVCIHTRACEPPTHTHNDNIALWPTHDVRRPHQCSQVPAVTDRLLHRFVHLTHIHLYSPHNMVAQANKNRNKQKYDK